MKAEKIAKLEIKEEWAMGYENVGNRTGDMECWAEIVDERIPNLSDRALVTVAKETDRIYRLLVKELKVEINASLKKILS